MVKQPMLDVPALYKHRDAQGGGCSPTVGPGQRLTAATSCYEEVSCVAPGVYGLHTPGKYSRTLLEHLYTLHRCSLVRKQLVARQKSLKLARLQAPKTHAVVKISIKINMK